MSKYTKQLRDWRNSPRGRLEADGAMKSAHMNRRALWLCLQLGLPPCPKIGRTMSPALADYCQTHGVSMDWLICGDLRGLQSMMQARRDGKAASTVERLLEKLARLSESEREVVRKVVDQMIEDAS